MQFYRKYIIGLFIISGFAARELCARLEHCRPQVVILANCGVEPSRVVPYRAILHQALAMCRSSLLQPPPSEGLTCLLFQRPGVSCPAAPSPTPPPGVRFVAWDAALATAQHAPCVPVESSHPLYVLYTSGTTAHPKVKNRR